MKSFRIFFVLLLGLSLRLPAQAVPDMYVQTALIRLPEKAAMQMLYGPKRIESDDLVFAKAMQQVGANEGEILSSTLSLSPGHGKTDAGEIKEYSYPTEFEVEYDKRDLILIPGAIESRRVGTEVHTFLSAPDKRGVCTLLVTLDHHLSPPRERPLTYVQRGKRITLPATQPEFRFERIATRVEVVPGRAVLAGAMTPPRIGADRRETVLDLLFVKLLPTTSEGTVGNAQAAGMIFDSLTFSVPESVGQALQDQGKGGEELFDQFLDAVARGKAQLEGVTRINQCEASKGSIVSGVEARVLHAVDMDSERREATPSALEEQVSGAVFQTILEGDKYQWSYQLGLSRPEPVQLKKGDGFPGDRKLPDLVLPNDRKLDLNQLVENKENRYLVEYKESALASKGGGRLAAGRGVSLLDVSTKTGVLDENEVKRTYFTFLRTEKSAPAPRSGTGN